MGESRYCSVMWRYHYMQTVGFVVFKQIFNNKRNAWWTYCWRWSNFSFYLLWEVRPSSVTSQGQLIALQQNSTPVFLVSNEKLGGGSDVNQNWRPRITVQSWSQDWWSKEEIKATTHVSYNSVLSMWYAGVIVPYEDSGSSPLTSTEVINKGWLGYRLETPVVKAVVHAPILCSPLIGKSHSPVVHLVWDQGVAGSNPVFPT